MIFRVSGYFFDRICCIHDSGTLWSNMDSVPSYAHQSFALEVIWKNGAFLKAVVSVSDPDYQCKTSLEFYKLMTNCHAFNRGLLQFLMKPLATRSPFGRCSCFIKSHRIPNCRTSIHLRPDVSRRVLVEQRRQAKRTGGQFS